MLQRFQQYIKDEDLFQTNEQLLLAVSGGVDSVVLCELCKRSGFQFSIAHCNFQLRGKESDEDESFVKQLAESYAVKYFSKKFETTGYAENKKTGIQEAARDLRYEWFAELIHDKTNAIDTLLTAHHANDNIETLLINFFKGTGIAGLQAIQPKTKRSYKIVRPLLFARKEEIMEFAMQNDLTYREDSSNSSSKYTRNFFRNELIPSIEKQFPKVADNLLKNISRFNEIGLLYKQSIEAHKKKLLFQQGNEIHIPVLKLLKTEPIITVVFEIIKDLGFSVNQVNDIVKLLHSESGKYVQSATHRILRNRKWLIISALSESQLLHFLIEENDQFVNFPLGKISVMKMDECKNLSADNNIAMLSTGKIIFPLLLRKWKQGDYFYPLGMEHKKKLSRFFIDQKLSLNEKENTWVLESNKRIAWVIGHRIDDRFKAADMKQVIKFTYNRSINAQTS